jgi:hypothetical protein
MMQVTSEQERRLYNLFEERLIDISQRVGYGEEEIGSQKYLVFEAAWDEYLGVLGVLRTLEVFTAHDEWSPHRLYVKDTSSWPSAKEDFVVLFDPLYTTGKWLEVPNALALKILALDSLP